MNILFLHSNRTWGGGEVWLTQIVAGLGERGHRVWVASPPDSALSLRGAALSPCLIPLKFSGDFNPVTILRLNRLMREKAIDVVCVHTEKELRLGGLASLMAKVPVVISREVDVPIKSTRLNRFFFREVAAAIIVNSYSTRNTLLVSAPWLQGKPMRVVWKGVDASRYRAAVPMNLRERFRIGEEDILAGFVGRLDEQKGVATLLDATSIVARRGARIAVVLAGEGNMLETVERYRREHKLEDRLYAAGFVEDVPSFLAAIDFLVQPSNWEGFGYAIVEAMAAGKPVIASQVSSIPELVDHYRTGILVPPREPEKLAQAMIALADESSLRRIMGTAGRVKAETAFTLQAMVENVNALFLEVTHHLKPAKNSPPGSI